ncbi:MAG: radical SAM family heme chaperone HemW [Chitinophagaceae bacterium]|nr:radical SAM family heme chaperone HemW [Chitinophagaceae bacterium]
MAGIYLHIPFCKQACHYCNFHFTTSLRLKNEMVAALLGEADLRKDYLRGEALETIYLGGGTPSLLESEELRSILKKIRSIHTVVADAEITLETNPDDITEERLKGWQDIGVNRLSIGVQSFFEEDLRWMNRAHSAGQAIRSLELAVNIFSNITMDLIYGHPLLSNEKWKKNVDTAISMGIPHLSCYALTVEPKTPLQKMIKMGKVEEVNSDKQSEQFLLLMQWLGDAGYEHYEISNFAKPGFRSRHNSSYWQGKAYLGLGPSAHSFDGNSRQWNVANNTIYIDSIAKGRVPFEKEELTPVQKINEHTMISLRTSEGLDLSNMKSEVKEEWMKRAGVHLERGLLRMENDHLVLTKEGKLFADGIAADLFIS